jgi:hypothetical protein
MPWSLRGGRDGLHSNETTAALSIAFDTTNAAGIGSRLPLEQITQQELQTSVQCSGEGQGQNWPHLNDHLIEDPWREFLTSCCQLILGQLPAGF